jgi:hypothetical protein
MTGPPWTEGGESADAAAAGAQDPPAQPDAEPTESTFETADPDAARARPNRRRRGQVDLGEFD